MTSATARPHRTARTDNSRRPAGLGRNAWWVRCGRFAASVVSIDEVGVVRSARPRLKPRVGRLEIRDGSPNASGGVGVALRDPWLLSECASGRKHRPAWIRRSLATAEPRVPLLLPDRRLTL